MKRFCSICLFILFFLSTPLLAEDLTFFVVSDPHYGYDMFENNERKNKKAIDNMNALVGKKYPESIGGIVARPKGVLVPGDLTSDGAAKVWNGPWYFPWLDGFTDDYDVSGNGRLHFPVYEGYGNHDYHNRKEWPVLEGIRLRNQARSVPVYTDKSGLHYSWDWNGIHFVNLNLYPGGPGDAENSLKFLQTDLDRRVGDSGKPVILMFHYDMLVGEDWWTQAEQAKFYQTLKAHTADYDIEYNIIAIITGHTHVSRHYMWRGIPVFNAPSVRDKGGYFVFKIRNGVITVAERSLQGWGRVWKVPYLTADKFLEEQLVRYGER